MTVKSGNVKDTHASDVALQPKHSNAAQYKLCTEPTRTRPIELPSHARPQQASTTPTHRGRQNERIGLSRAIEGGLPTRTPCIGTPWTTNGYSTSLATHIACNRTVGDARRQRREAAASTATPVLVRCPTLRFGPFTLVLQPRGLPRSGHHKAPHVRRWARSRSQGKHSAQQKWDRKHSHSLLAPQPTGQHGRCASACTAEPMADACSMPYRVQWRTTGGPQPRGARLPAANAPRASFRVDATGRSPSTGSWRRGRTRGAATAPSSTAWPPKQARRRPLVTGGHCHRDAARVGCVRRYGQQ